ncbi:MAG: response regulator, partial [Lachnospiraceae bacterium]|nr:response regulator [Lachnospiraceae bacterium]
NIHVIVAMNGDEISYLETGILTNKFPLNGFAVVRAMDNDAAKDHSTETFMNRQLICPYVRALVVDDEPMNLVVAKGVFRDYRLIVETANSGREALKKCETEHFDLIFLDHMMPEMDGVEVMHLLRKAHPDAPFHIIALTANATSSARDMFFREGFDEFLAKPLENTELERVLRKLLPESSVTYIAAS